MAERWPAARTIDSVVVDGQLIRIKASAARAKAEHEDVAAAARRTGRPLRELAFQAEAAYAATNGGGVPGKRAPIEGETARGGGGGGDESA